MSHPLTVTLVLGLLAPLPAVAQTVLSGDHSVDGRLCAGPDCTNSELFSSEELMLKDTAPRLLFEDTGNSPNTDWMLVANDGFDGGQDYFAVTNASLGRQIVRIENLAPANGLYLDGAGELGLGTSLPQREIHMKGGDAATIRFEKDTSTGGTAQTWDILTDHVAFSVLDQTAGREVVRITAGTRANALFINDDGQLGLGTASPTAPLHIPRDDGTARILLEETNAVQSARTLLQVINNGRPEIVMSNTATSGEWSFGAGTNFILKQGGLNSLTADKTKLFEVKGGTGNVVAAGTITSGGTTCGGGCDRVFTENLVIPAAQYHAAMWDQGYLPHVGPTPENQPINVTEKLGGMLNALEHAHVYIEALEARTTALEAELAALRTELATKTR